MDWIKCLRSSFERIYPRDQTCHQKVLLERRWMVLRFLLICLLISCSSASLLAELRVGRAVVDVTPRKLPVLRNGGFVEASVDRVLDPIHARCLVLEDGDTRVAVVIVDSCMMPRTMCDAVKTAAAKTTGIAPDKMLIAATHTHSAPSVMDFTLGCRADPNYAKQLPLQLVRVIEVATKNLQEAKLAVAVADASQFTKNRRWITRPDALQSDPFGERTVRAMMHPGHQNPDFTGPSGPVDPWLSILSFQTPEGRPLAVLANFSMHYFGGHPGISSDYFGLFCRRMSERLAPNDPQHLTIMSQGTSGDLWWGDYSRPPQQRLMSDFVDELVALANGELERVQHQPAGQLQMQERRMEIDRRTPDSDRLAWAQRKLNLMGDRRPKDRPEVYAEQAVYLDNHPSEEIVLQAIRIGDVAITAMPNEVYALTGLKLKAQSPLPSTFNVELANGAAGYIPPPEQHELGGYTTWPARTAGLAVDAEPKIVASLLDMLEELSGGNRLANAELETAHSREVVRLHPQHFWRLDDLQGEVARDSVATSSQARFIGGHAFFLPGIDLHQPSTGSSRALQLAGGHLQVSDVQLDTDHAISLWCYLSVPVDWREITGVLVSSEGATLQVTGSAEKQPGRLQMGTKIGTTPIVARQWYHVALVRDANERICYLNGKEEFRVAAPKVDGKRRQLLLGGSNQPNCSWEGKLDEVALFGKAMNASQIANLYRVASQQLARDDSPQIVPMIVEGGAIPDLPPLSASASMQRAKTHDGYTIQLVASEPLVADPVAIDWDLRGRLWVVEMADYPYGMDGQGKPGGRIRILEDTNHDGQYDRSTLFLDGLSFPTAVMPWGDGAFITAAPNLIFAKDTDGDGQADDRQVLFQGFMEGNQQLRVNGLRWGLDNWIYCANGGHHAGFGASNSIRLSKTGESLTLGSRDFRFHPVTGDLHPQSGPSQFGRVRDDWGHWFGVQNSYPLWHYVLQDHYLRRNVTVAYGDTRKQLRLPANPPVYSTKAPQKRYHSFENSGHYTSACGPCIYRDELLFSNGDQTHAFTCEPFHNLVQHHVLQPAGVSFEGMRAPTSAAHDFFASSDRWSRPVMARTGPDGALWIVDMYRFMIEHPDWLPEEARQELKPYYRAGESKGRIYRIVPDDQTTRPFTTCQKDESIEELVNQLESSNGSLRDKIQAHVVAGQRREAIPSLRRLLMESDEALARLHALATLEGLSSATHQDLRLGLGDSHAEVRCFSLRCLEHRSLDTELVEAATRLHADPNQKVQLQLAFTLGELDDPDASTAFVRLVRTTKDSSIISALISSLPQHYEAAVDLLQTDQTVDSRFWDAVLRLSSRRPRQLSQLLEILLPADKSQPTSRQIKLATQWLAIVTEQGDSIENLIADNPDLLAPLSRLEAMFDRAWQLAGNSDVDLIQRVQSLNLVRYDPRPVTDFHPQLQVLLQADQPFKVQSAAVTRLGVRMDQAASDLLLEAWTTYSPSLRIQVLDQLLGQVVGAQTLLDAIESGGISPLELDAARRDQLIKHQDATVAEKAAVVLEQVTATDRKKVIERYRSSLQLSGSVTHGQELFAKLCANCHGSDEKKRIGPHLRALTDRSSRSLLTAILNPSAAVEPRYLGYAIELKSGQTWHGLISGESGESLELRLLDGTRKQIVRSSIELLQNTGQSFMPNGLEQELTPQELADVIAYVQSL
ncbi:MAG: c-type cytochrome [Planctomycetaceae bacterium]|nr:c-type cytochrome [Planctomycetaceae bacterium]